MIEHGVGLIRSEPGGGAWPLHGFEARMLTHAQAEAVITEAPGALHDRLRLAALALAELSLLGWRRAAGADRRERRRGRDRTPILLRRLNLKSPTRGEGLTPRGEAAFLHMNTARQRAAAPRRGQPSDPRILDVLSDAARHLARSRPIVRRPYDLLRNLCDMIHPPLVDLRNSPAATLRLRILKRRATARGHRRPLALDGLLARAPRVKV